MTAQELADKIGVCKDYIYMIEGGRRTPSLGILRKIAKALNTEISNILSEE